MTTQQRRAKWVYIGAGLISVLLVVFLLWSLRTLILPVILGALLAYLFRPLKSKMKVEWLPDAMHTVAVFLVIFAGVFLFTRLVRENLPDERGQLELQVRMQYKINKKYEEVMGLDRETGQGHMLYSWVGEEANPLMNHINELLTLTPEQQAQFVNYWQTADGDAMIRRRYYQYFQENLRHDAYRARPPKADRNPAQQELAPSERQTQEGRKGAALKALANALSTWIVMPLVFVFLLMDNGQILQSLIRYIPNRYFELTLTVLYEVDDAIGKYLRGTLLECALVGITIAIGLFLIGIQLPIALVIGVIAGITNAIPFLGPVMGLVAGMSYALIAEDITPLLPWMTADDVTVGVLIVVGIAQLLDNAFYQPVVLGSAVNLHPLVVVLGVVGGSVLLGFAGMLLAIPTIVVCKEVASTLYKELKAYKII